MTKVRAAVVVAAGLAAVALTGCGSDAGTRVDASSPSAPPAGESELVRADIDPCPVSGAPVVGDDTLPDVVLDCLGPGKPVEMAGLSGRPTLVNVWASWCEPCRAEMPWLQRLADTGSVRVLGVDAEDESGAASALLDELGVTFPSVFDPSNSFARGVGVVSKPMSVLVDADGRVVKVVPGPFDSYPQLVQTIESELDVTLP